jgi:Fe-S cluster biogenesis protein NfuA
MSDLNQRVEQALEEIRPFLKSDGGDIEIDRKKIRSRD